MKLAEFDLKIRGAGNMYGTEQHGYTDLKLADITNAADVHKAQASVDLFLRKYTLENYPYLQHILEQYQTHQISKD